MFLDEIGNLPLELQQNFSAFSRSSSSSAWEAGATLQVDVRVIAATNQDLWHMVEERKFRADLYYRLNVFPMLLPELRERKHDIPPWVEHFVRKFAARDGKSIKHVPNDVMEVLKRRDWPGNIRELQNFVERSVIVTTGPVLRLPISELTGREVGSVPPRTLADAERAHIMAILRKTNWVVGGRNGAAAKLGLPRTTLIARMQRLGISRDTFGRRGEQPDFGTVPSMCSHAPEVIEQDDYV